LVGIIAAAKIFRNRQPPTDVPPPSKIVLGDTAA
jgi:hypothetical protein